MKLLETCKFNFKQYISGSNDFICEHPVLFYELDCCNKYGQIYECPICGKKFNSAKDKITQKALDNRYLVRTNGVSTKHFYYAILVIIRKIAFTYMNHSEVNLPEVLKKVDPEIQDFLIRTNPHIQYKNMIEEKVKTINIGKM